MDDDLEPILDDILTRIAEGQLVTPTWIREHFAAHASSLIDILRIGGMLQPPAQRAISRVGPLRLLHELGRGGMGTVYLAEVAEPFRALDPGRRVAVKILHDHLVDDRRVQRRFLREGVVGRRIRHTNVVRTLAACRFRTEHGLDLCLLMEPVEGTTLAHLRKRGTRTSEELCRFVALEVAHALQAIHDQGLVHCDIKPQNVILTTDQRVCVMDLGVAQVTAQGPDGQFAGSILYAAPEQLDPDQGVDARADLYALGVTLYELATGDVPESMGPHKLPSTYSPYFVEVVRALTEPDPRRRFASSDELAEVLEKREDSLWWRQRDSKGPHRVAIPRGHGVLRGRDREATRLQGLLTRSARGTGQVVVLMGDAGVGKSQLVADFVSTLDASKTILASCARTPRGERRSLRVALRSDPAIQGHAEHLPPRVRSVFRAWLEGDQARHAAPGVLSGALVHIARRLSNSSASVIWIDDLQEALPAELQLLAALARGVANHRILLIVVARPKVPQSWLAAVEQLDHVSRIDLGPLSDDAASQLLADAAHPRLLAEALRRRVVERAQGNPLLLLTLWREIQAGGAGAPLERRIDGRWHLPEHVTELPLPEAIEELVAARLGRLSETELRLLQAAACDGEEVDVPTVAAVMQMPQLEALTTLETIAAEHRLLRTDAGSVRFDHPLVHEVTRSRTPKAAQRDLHARYADVLSAVAEPGGRDAARICQHAITGLRADLVSQTARQAFEYLMATNRPEAAVSLGRDACAFPGALDDRTRMALLDCRSLALIRLGMRAEEREVLREWREIADARGTLEDRVSVRNRLAVYFQNGHEYDEAMACVRDALKLMEAHPKQRLRIQSWITWSNIEGSRGNLEQSMRVVRRAQVLATELDDRRGLLAVEQHLGADYFQIDPGKALQHFESALELARELDDPHAEVYTLAHLGELHCSNHQYDVARSCFDACIEEAGSMGLRRALALTQGQSACLSTSIGLLGRSWAMLESAISETLALGDHVASATFLAELSNLALFLGDIVVAREKAERALDVIATLQVKRDLAPRCVLALVDWRSGEQDRARRDMQPLLEPVNDPFARRDVAYFQMQWAEALALSGHAQEAIEQLSQVPPESAIVLTQFRPGALVEAWRAALQGERVEASDVFFERSVRRAPMLDRMRLAYLLWCTNGDGSYLQHAQRDLASIVSEAPEAYWSSVIEDVPLHALIHAGVPLPR